MSAHDIVTPGGLKKDIFDADFRKIFESQINIKQSLIQSDGNSFFY